MCNVIQVVQRVGLPTMLAGVALGLTAPGPISAAPRPAHAASRPPLVRVWRVTTLDAHGRVARVFHPGSAIRLRIEWIARRVPPHASETTAWTVSYARRRVLHVVKTAVARDGNWSRITTATVARAPDLGSYVFEGRVAINGVAVARSVTFVVRR